jgi:phage-related protein (TIGR01555 family)
MAQARISMAKMRDGMKNFVANLGTSKDKKSHSRFYQERLDWEELNGLYTSSWIAGKTVDIPVEDATRNWRCVKSPSMSPKELEAYTTAEEELQVREIFSRAAKWARLYGGAVILLGIDGAGPLDTPLDFDKVKKGSLKFLHVIDRHDLGIDQINTTDPTRPNYRLPEFYRVTGGATQIHYTRVIRFDGLDTPWRVRKNNQYWGISILERIYNAIVNAQTVADSVASMTYEASIDVVKVKNLFQQLAAPGGHDKVVDRFVLADIIKSNNNMLILDETESYEKSTVQFGALPDLLVKFLNSVAAAADIPATRMLGQSASGLNATGEHDMFNYYNMVQSKQETDLAPRLQYLDEVMTRSVYGKKPEDWSFTFNPLWESPPSAKATIELQNAQRDETYLRNGVIDTVVVAEQLREDDVYNAIDDDYLEVLEELEEEREKEPLPLPPNQTPQPDQAKTQTVKGIEEVEE